MRYCEFQYDHRKFEGQATKSEISPFLDIFLVKKHISNDTIIIFGQKVVRVLQCLKSFFNHFLPFSP